MERRTPILTAAELEALLGGRPRTVSEELSWVGRAAEAGTGGGLARPAGAIRRLVAEALRGAADAIHPAAGH